MKIEVRRISPDEVIPIRWQILRPGFPRESAVFDADCDATTEHLGAFIEGRLIGVASTYSVPSPDTPEILPARQLRGMATLPQVRGGGAGRELLNACHQSAVRQNCRLIWCNARVSAVAFYQKYGWNITSHEFDISTVGPHYRMALSLSSAAGN